jgi:hypothetical protein
MSTPPVNYNTKSTLGRRKVVSVTLTLTCRRLLPGISIFSSARLFVWSQRVVRLGDENKTIPIDGRGTLCINVLGHAVAYANALHVPDLSAILLSTRVHRRVTQGYSFLADHDGCFFTYPNFTVEIADTDDCVIPCSRLPPGTPLDFDACLHLPSEKDSTCISPFVHPNVHVITCSSFEWPEMHDSTEAFTWFLYVCTPLVIASHNQFPRGQKDALTSLLIHAF